MDKIKFIEETKIKRATKNEPEVPKGTVTNPIRAGLMKFVHAKLHKNIFKNAQAGALFEDPAP